ncbi:MAG: precorrin-6A reductase [Lachnospiraceae bacterium]
MKRFLIFGGTTEGRTLAESLLLAGYSADLCVATSYGEEVLQKHPHLNIHQGRLTEEEMETLLLSGKWEAVIDATHPYAVEVSENIRRAGQHTGREIIRLLRSAGQQETDSDVIYVTSLEEGVRFLNKTEGNILLTTGSKELPKYVSLIEDVSRIYARILSDGAAVDKCREMGLCGKQIICMQGPFSAELNAALIRQYDIRYLVTKDTALAGGFPEKLEGARLTGAKVLVVSRPAEETGYSMEELLKRFHAEKPVRQKVTLLGIGMGSLKDLTQDGRKACERADVILGASRMVDALSCFGRESEKLYKPEDVISYILNHPEKKQIVAAFSGDIGFYSGCKKLLEELKKLPVDTEVLCGISSMVCLASRLQIPWEDMYPVSIHGRSQNVLGAVRSHEKVFVLAGYKESIRKLCQDLTDYGMGEVKVFAGCQLGYPEESVTVGTARELTDFSKEGLCAAVIENKAAADQIITHGLPDAAFERGNAPMTKEEIRAVSLSKLALTRQAIVYDIGAGTGSIGLECALQSVKGMVYAIEKKEDALELLRKNKQRLHVSNMEIVAGCAPEVLEKLPAPTHAFIGGSSGNMREIIEALLLKNPEVRIVINCIALETAAEVMNILREKKFRFEDIVQVSVGKSRTLGNYHMMMGQNPVFILTLQGGET